MEWTDQQCDETFDAYWKQGGFAVCPIHGDPLDVNFDTQLGSPNYTHKLRCRKFGGGYERNRQDDHLAHLFRPWTPEEEAELKAAYVAGRDLRCPIDGSKLNAKTETRGGRVMMGITAEAVRCERCNNVTDVKENPPR